MFLLGALLAAIALGVFLSSSDDETGSGTESVSVAGPRETPEPSGPPTPFFASCRSLRIALPVAPESVTLLAFHQASGDKVLHLESLAPDADMNELVVNATDGEFTTSAKLAEENGAGSDGYIAAVWHGEVLRLWRSNRSGPPDTAADIGAPPGTEVRSPVTGTVLAVRRYQLYDRWEDFEVHIQPDGWPEVDVVLIHVANIRIAEGDRVVGGVTPIATVRCLSDKVDLQLGGYTGDGGDHVHLQLNRMPVPGVLEFVGGS